MHPDITIMFYHGLTETRVVAPAELEGVLIEHPGIIDAGVIGVWSESEQTELPR